MSKSKNIPEKIEVTYTYDDWQGSQEVQSRVSGNFLNVPILFKDENIIRVYRIAKPEMDKIRTEQERLFCERVNQMTERYKSEYQAKADKSMDLPILFKDEIEALENLFYPDKVKVPILQNGEPNLIKGKGVIWGIGLINGAGLRRLRETYQTWVIDGKRDYSYVKYIQNDFSVDVPVSVIALKLYYDWLKEKPKKIENHQPAQQKLTVKQIALIHIYNQKTITRENADSIAGGYGFNSKRSGEGLFQDYTFYSSTANRKGKPNPPTQKKISNKIEMFEGINQYLTDAGKKWANDEIQILKTFLETEHL